MNDLVTGTDIAMCLRLELAAVEAFLEILRKEQEALIEGRIESLEVLAAEKSQMAGQLAELAARRNRGLASRNLSPNREGLEAWLADAKSASAWRDLLVLAQTARQLNCTNGEMISVRLRHSQQAFAALQSAAGAVSLYGPRGQTFGFSGTHPLGRV